MDARGDRREREKWTHEERNEGEVRAPELCEGGAMTGREREGNADARKGKVGESSRGGGSLSWRERRERRWREAEEGGRERWREAEERGGSPNEEKGLGRTESMDRGNEERRKGGTCMKWREKQMEREKQIRKTKKIR